MRILIGLGHPAHFHLFHKLILHYLERNISFKITINGKDILEKLLIENNISYEIIINKSNKGGLFFKFFEQIRATNNFLKIVNRFKPTLMIGCINQIAHIGWLKSIPSLFFAEDDFKATLIQGLIVYPFVSKIVTPDCTNVGFFKFKQIPYAGYHELAYLHPSTFIPDKSKVIKLTQSEHPFFIIRFAQLKAYHDRKVKGIDIKLASDIINRLSKKGQVFITSEQPIHKKFEKFRINISYNDIHHIMAFALLFIGDSQTMTAEAAILGTPTIRYNDFVGKLGYLEELENRYKLGYGYRPGNSKELLSKIDSLINEKYLKKSWNKKRDKMLSEKINVNSFIIWFVENYPDSVKIMKENPDFQYNFK